jgi:hypothetical protein
LQLKLSERLQSGWPTALQHQPLLLVLFHPGRP